MIEEMTSPNQGTWVYTDKTPLNLAGLAAYNSANNLGLPHTVAGSITLWLNLDFTNLADIISIGAIEISYQ